MPGSSLVPADVYIPSFTDVSTAVDVSVVHRPNTSRTAHAPTTIRAAAEARAAEKVATFSEECRLRSWDYWAVRAVTT